MSMNNKERLRLRLQRRNSRSVSMSAPAQHDEVGEGGEHAGDDGRERCAGHAHPRERSQPEDGQRVEDDVQDEPDSHDPEREDGVALTAEERIDGHGEQAEEAAQEVLLYLGHKGYI